jgi:hypothetical protein
MEDDHIVEIVGMASIIATIRLAINRFGNLGELIKLSHKVTDQYHRKFCPGNAQEWAGSDSPERVA